MRADVLALDLPVTPAAPGMVRRAVEALDLAAAERESARLLASELVTNAVIHSRSGSIRVGVQITGVTLRLSVTDDGTAESTPWLCERPGIEGGFGLVVVDRLAARWGVERSGATTVWCELAVGDPRGPQRPTDGPAPRRPRVVS